MLRYHKRILTPSFSKRETLNLNARSNPKEIHKAKAFHRFKNAQQRKTFSTQNTKRVNESSFQLEGKNSHEKINLTDNRRSQETTIDQQFGEQVIALWNQERPMKTHQLHCKH